MAVLNNILKYILPFILLVLLQVLILDRIDMGMYFIPYVYILFILTLPTETQGWTTLLLAFLLGLIMDAFTSMPGLHTSATLLLAFCRKYLLQLMAPREGYDFGTRPTIAHMGLVWFAVYAGILTFIHHFYLFSLELFRIEGYFLMIIRALASTLLSLAIMLTLQLFDPTERKK